MNLINGAQPSNVFWQIGSSATLGTSSGFAGTIMALSSISMNDSVTLNGRALARNAAVTLINDTITAPRITWGETEPPAVDAGGDLQDLADDYVGGQAAPSLAVMATDDLSGVAHLGLSEVGNTELAGTDLDCGVPRTCDLDVDGSFPVNMASLSSGKHTLQATARDEAGNVGVSSPWAVYVDREAPGLATGFGATATARSVGASPIEAVKPLVQRASGSNTDVYWTDPDDPKLSDGAPGAGVSTYSYRYHVGTQAWSAWTASDSPDFSLSSAGLGSSVSLEVRSIDAVGNIGAVSSATVTVTAGDSSVSRGFVGESGGTSRAAGAPPVAIFYCTFTNNLDQTRLGTGRNDAKNAVRATGSATCYNRANPKEPDKVAEVVASHYSLRVCIRSVEGSPGSPFPGRKLKCTHFNATAPPLPTPPSPVSKVNKMPTISHVCRTGNSYYRVVTRATYHGPIVDQIPPSAEDQDVTTTYGPFRCNEPGAWRYLARRGAGSASKQLGDNIQCRSTYCDRLPPGGTNDDRRGWEAHHIVPAGEGRDSEHSDDTQAERAERYMYACDFLPNQPPNGVWLRGRNLRSPSTAYTNLSGREKKRPNHARIHTTSYFRAVANDLSPYANDDGQCRGGDAMKSKLRDIKDAIKTGEYSGLPASSKNP